MILSKETLRSTLNKRLGLKIDEKYKKVKAELFEDDSHLKNLQNKIDSIRKEVADLNIRKRNSDNDAYKKNIDTSIESKRRQVKTIQKSLQGGRLSGTDNKRDE